MILQEGKYIKEYFGIYRDIVLNEKSNDVIIYFNAYLLDDLNFQYRKHYISKDEAIGEVATFLKGEPNVQSDKLEYSKIMMKEINDSIHKFLKAILNRQVNLPAKDFQFVGDIDYIRKMSNSNRDFIQKEI